MEERTFTITLADGTVLKDLGLNGNNYVSKSKLTEEDFADNLSSVTIAGSDGSLEEYENLELVQIQKYGKEYWFVLRQLSAQELAALKTQADIEYIAMMADIDLEEVY